MIRSEGAKAGVVINPATPVATLEDVLDVADYVLVMSVNPGFGGQQFIPNALLKVRELAARRKALGLHFPIQIDGGVNTQNLGKIIDAGVEWVVAGSSIFHTVNPPSAFEEMRRISQDATAIRA
jgi:ribulose-phosphate 3-epimerase